MKPRLKLGLLAAVVMLALGWAGSARASTTMDPVNRYSYGANIGWMNWYADGVNGAVVTDYTLSGFIYAANVGWINLGGERGLDQLREHGRAGDQHQERPVQRVCVERELRLDQPDHRVYEPANGSYPDRTLGCERTANSMGAGELWGDGD